jgi:hypothetical protein
MKYTIENKIHKILEFTAKNIFNKWIGPWNQRHGVSLWNNLIQEDREQKEIQVIFEIKILVVATQSIA